MSKIQMGGRWVGKGEPVFIVVETGTTCNGNLDTALRMVDAAVEARADAIKFMIIDPDYFMSDRKVTYDYEWAQGKASENMYEMFKKLKFSPDEWKKICDYCRKKGIIFYATVDYIPGVDLAESLEPAAFKLSSWDVRHFPLIRKMARTGRPIVIDLGPTYITDIEKMINVIREEGNHQILLEHCSHSKTDDGINVRTVPFLEDLFHLPVGYSADSRDIVPDIAAVTLGARLIEKRLTLDRTQKGHHHVKGVEPAELKEWVEMIRRTEAVLGSYTLIPSPEDLRQRELYFVSLCADRDIKAGTVITAEMLACKRPGHGTSPEFMSMFVGRAARRDIKQNELLAWSDV
jgi:N-acetylneuraminate synthase/N,N'-diacetyllegionaminate synthase